MLDHTRSVQQRRENKNDEHQAQFLIRQTNLYTESIYVEITAHGLSENIKKESGFQFHFEREKKNVKKGFFLLRLHIERNRFWNFRISNKQCNV